MALPQRRVSVELRRIASDADYRAALARIAELVDTDDLESSGELETLANWVESWEEKRPR